MCLRRLRKSKLKKAKCYKIVSSNNKPLFMSNQVYQIKYLVGNTYKDTRTTTLYAGHPIYNEYSTGYHAYDVRSINYEELAIMVKEASRFCDYDGKKCKVLLVELSNITAFGDSDLSFTLKLTIHQRNKLRSFAGRKMTVLADITEDIIQPIQDTASE